MNNSEEWIDYLTEEERQDYYNWKYETIEEFEKEKNNIFFKSFEDGQKLVHIPETSPLHPDNPYYQKFIPHWDWIEIHGELNEDKYDLVINELDGVKSLRSYASCYSKVYNIPDKYGYLPKYSNLRVKIEKRNNNQNYLITLSIASKERNKKLYKDLFIYVRSQLIKNTIKIKRLDLSFLTLLDLSDINIKYKYYKTQKITKSSKNETETVSLNEYNSATRINLYNKKIQLKQKKDNDIDIDIDYLYNLEFTIKEKDHKSILRWRHILDDLTLNKNILNYYQPKQYKQTKTSKNEYYYALMYLYINDRALFKQKYPKKMKPMEREYKRTQKELEEKKIDFDYVPKLKEVLKDYESLLSQQIEDLTGCKI